MSDVNQDRAGQTALARGLFLAAAHRFGGDWVDPGLTAELCSLPTDVVDHAAEALVLEQIQARWTHGWQPAELLRQGRIGCHSTPAARLVALAIAVDHAGRRSVNLHHRWVAEIESLELPRVRAGARLIGQWSTDERLDRTEVVAVVADVLANMMVLPPLDPLLPPPGSGADAPLSSWFFDRLGASDAASDPVLARIRNLLAKAESSTFEAEASAFTAKAQELMTRHAIDAAFVMADPRRGREQAAAIRLPVDAPYVDAKAQLLHTVAAATRCRAVLHVELALCTVVGFPSDLASVELLFTSLLVQAQSAMDAAARVAHAGTRVRTKAFRSAFLTAYTARIGERLRETNAAVYAEVEAQHGGDFLPVLRSRAEAVDEFIADRFGALAFKSARRRFDGAGWASGRAAADNARLTVGDLTGTG